MGAGLPFGLLEIPRRSLEPDDVLIRVHYCGVCHSDVHTVRNDWGRTGYPCVPGHEIVGRVAQVGTAVTRHAVGDRVGVGCMVASCKECTSCRRGEEQHCRGSVLTYDGVDPHGTSERTFGGYSSEVVVGEDFVLRIPDGLDDAAAAPVLCAGITVYSPLRRFRAGPGTRVGVAGYGGLGMMATAIARALGAEVTVLTRSRDKEGPARAAGASDLVVVTDPDDLRRATRSLDLILSTVPVDHDVNPYLSMLRRDGCLVLLGYFGPLTSPVQSHLLTSGRLTLTGSTIGGIRETQEALDFCAEHGIAPHISTIEASCVDAIYEQLANGEPAHRFVIDLASLRG